MPSRGRGATAGGVGADGARAGAGRQPHGGGVRRVDGHQRRRRVAGSGAADSVEHAHVPQGSHAAARRRVQRGRGRHGRGGHGGGQPGLQSRRAPAGGGMQRRQRAPVRHGGRCAVASYGVDGVARRRRLLLPPICRRREVGRHALWQRHAPGVGARQRPSVGWRRRLASTARQQPAACLVRRRAALQHPAGRRAEPLQPAPPPGRQPGRAGGGTHVQQRPAAHREAARRGLEPEYLSGGAAPGLHRLRGLAPQLGHRGLRLGQPKGGAEQRGLASSGAAARSTAKPPPHAAAPGTLSAWMDSWALSRGNFKHGPRTGALLPGLPF
mmetsp:Transcript_35939/g.90646  ORF Transcript_35939/g.90646 Transcript_35939/m.90646 type:complete len:326 (-) Transcript_35939:194-1171(-)